MQIIPECRTESRHSASSRRCSGEAIDNQVQQSAHTRQAAEVAMIAYEHVASGRNLANVDGDNTGCGVAQRAGEHRKPGASRTELSLDLPVVAAESDFGLGQRAPYPHRVRHVGK